MKTIPDVMRIRALIPLVAAAMGTVVLACGGCDLNAPGGGSNAHQEPVPPSEPPPGEPAPPQIISLSPVSTVAGSADFELTVTGQDFDADGTARTEVVWSANGTEKVLSRKRATATEIAVLVPAELLQTPVVADLYVQNYDVGSNAALDKGEPVSFVVTTLEALQFVSVGPMTAARSGHTATMLADGRVLIIGGDTTAELFDPRNDSFMATGGPSFNQTWFGTALLDDGTVLVVGAGGELHGELYDPRSGTFAPVGPLHEPHSMPTVTRLADGRVLIAGGIGSDGPGGAIANAEVYDPVMRKFTEVGAMRSARAEHAAVLLTTGEVLVAGGRNGYAPDSLDDPPWDPMFAELFDPGTDMFTSSASMQTTRVDLRAVALADGRALVLGGLNDYPQNLHEQPAHPPFAQVYDRRDGGFMPLRTARACDRGYRLTLVDDNRALLIGGELHGEVRDSVLTLDTASGGLVETGHLSIARSGHTATLLRDGRVLVTGGSDVGGNPLDSAEITTTHITHNEGESP